LPAEFHGDAVDDIGRAGGSEGEDIAGLGRHASGRVSKKETPAETARPAGVGAETMRGIFLSHFFLGFSSITSGMGDGFFA
jgi:hypothetical protein